MPLTDTDATMAAVAKLSIYIRESDILSVRTRRTKTRCPNQEAKKDVNPASPVSASIFKNKL